MLGSLSARRGYLDAPTGQVHYRTAGTGQPILLFHQSPSSSLQYAAAFPFLVQAGFQVIAVDTPGYGMSDIPPVAPSVEVYSSVFPTVLDHFGLKRTAVLGHHTGASIACEVGCHWPDRVNALILNGTPVYSEENRRHNLARWRQEPVPVEESGEHLLEPWRRRLAVSFGWTDLHAMTRNVVEMLEVRDHEWLGFVAAFNYDLPSRLRDLSVRTMLLTNTGDDLYRRTLRAREIRPDFAFVELNGGTHDIVDEQPEAWAKAVSEFVNREP